MLAAGEKEMRNVIARSLLFLAAVGLVCVVAVPLTLTSAFSTTHYSNAPDINIVGRRQRRRRRATTTGGLCAEPCDGDEKSSRRHSRRGFLDSCRVVAATAVTCGAAASARRSPSNSIEPSSSASEERTAGAAPTDGTAPAAAATAAAAGSSTPLSSIDSPELTAFQESVSGFVSGSAVSAVKTLIKYPLDTAAVRLQMPRTPYTVRDLPSLFAGSFDGVAAPLLSSVPAGAIFFAVKDAAKSTLKEPGGRASSLPRWASTSLAVAAALPPYWLIRNPSEVVKTRLQVGADGYVEGTSTLDAFRIALSSSSSRSGGNSTAAAMEGAIRELYRGYPENILYGFPADVIKFVAYDYLTGAGEGKKNVSPAEGAVFGALSTAAAQLATTPLDVMRNRIMAEATSSNDGGEGGEDSKIGAAAANGGGLAKKMSYVDRLATIAREEGAGALFAGSWPRVGKAVLSGAIQFATYEETKQKMSELFLGRRR